MTLENKKLKGYGQENYADKGNILVSLRKNDSGNKAFYKNDAYIKIKYER